MQWAHPITSWLALIAPLYALKRASLPEIFMLAGSQITIDFRQSQIYLFIFLTKKTKNTVSIQITIESSNNSVSAFVIRRPIQAKSTAVIKSDACPVTRLVSQLRLTNPNCTRHVAASQMLVRHRQSPTWCAHV